MKTKILFLLFTSILLSCKTTYGQTGAKDVKARLIVCSGLSEKNVPLDDLKEIYVKEGEKVTLYVKWFNLEKKSYVTSMDFLDTNGNYLAQSSEYKFKPKKKTHNTWNKRKFRKVIVPEGVVKIRINLDEEIILERDIEIKYKSK
ncbi:hypothetical protein KO506_12300 [Polaribacter vadi]|uniref:hypothetical protein n=1 Tax=Polaribacter TaxID=52959 RepID=UPI001C09A92E|nr:MULTISPECIES: hypothetical protein [Polaribacter]MBU3012189.1 hypothetical protein [Polaribacter vadi]MDO6742005.1 hypothetical protein [Polaribacter sp. 1_MG-2023]